MYKNLNRIRFNKIDNNYTVNDVSYVYNWLVRVFNLIGNNHLNTYHITFYDLINRLCVYIIVIGVVFELVFVYNQAMFTTQICF